MRIRLCLLVCFGIAVMLLPAQQINNADTLSTTSPSSLLPALLASEAQGVVNPDLYYNIGVCHFHLGDTGRAMLYFLRCQSLDSSHPQARANLAYLRSLEPGRESREASTLSGRFIDGLLASLTLTRLAWAFLALALLCALSIHWLLHYPRHKERGLPLLVSALLFLLLISVGTAWALKDHARTHDRRAVVLGGDAGLFPSPESPDSLRVLERGSVVKVLDPNIDRIRVEIEDGSIGWISGNCIEPVNPKAPKFKRKR